ncbi:adenosyltransferase 2 subunit beta [Seminavis robusta]|uniref:Adenosyltransferase 2 subunit beta n=1 Tax=Seminavis robusta TaxID=568900 RepID=A0A9N8E889_9STRA|nr:adenosyltransferase 2 subunit beta [Seminavis robusta]|eukprot:Sro729_g193870.1 adenosyltransferase 2 subunit beta (316) ;mRNA; f:35792-36739
MKSSIPQIVLTGSSGFLGQHLLHSLIHEPLKGTANAALEIHALYGGMEGFPEAVSSMMSNSQVKVHVHQLDLTDSAKVQAWIDQYAAALDICVHSAALSVPRVCEKDPDKARALNVPTTFLEGLAKHNVRIIGLSTDQVYDGTKGNYKEDVDSVNPLNVYGQTKVQLEELVVKLSSSNVLLRSSIILGPKAPFLPEKAHGTFLHFCASRENQETTFFTDECRSVIATDTVVQIIRWFLQKIMLPATNETTKTTAGIFHMGGPDNVSRMDMAKAAFTLWISNRLSSAGGKGQDASPRSEESSGHHHGQWEIAKFDW